MRFLLCVIVLAVLLADHHSEAYSAGGGGNVNTGVWPPSGRSIKVKNLFIYFSTKLLSTPF